MCISCEFFHLNVSVSIGQALLNLTNTSQYDKIIKQHHKLQPLDLDHLSKKRLEQKLNIVTFVKVGVADVLDSINLC